MNPSLNRAGLKYRFIHLAWFTPLMLWAPIGFLPSCLKSGFGSHPNGRVIVSMINPFSKSMDAWNQIKMQWTTADRRAWTAFRWDEDPNLSVWGWLCLILLMPFFCSFFHHGHQLPPVERERKLIAVGDGVGGEFDRFPNTVGSTYVEMDFLFCQIKDDFWILFYLSYSYILLDISAVPHSFPVEVW